MLFLFFASQSSAGQGRSQSPRPDPIGFAPAKVIVEGTIGGMTKPRLQHSRFTILFAFIGIRTSATTLLPERLARSMSGVCVLLPGGVIRKGPLVQLPER